MIDRRGTTALAVLALAAPLWGCPPNLTGESCNSDCACPTSETCAMSSSGTGTCQDGTNTCAGVLPDGGQLAFAGYVVLNGGAPPSNAVEIYGYADGNPNFDGGNYVDADLMQLSTNGDFAFSGSVPPATGIGYHFDAVYDTNPHGADFNIDQPGVFGQGGASMLAPGSDAGLSVRIDVQTSTCFSLTTDIQPAGVTVLLATGIVAYDIRTGGPLTESTDFDSAYAVFDAGSRVPFIDAGSPYGQLTLVPVGTVMDTEITNSWLYAPPGLTAISDEGSFFFSFTDGTSGKPEYPAGSCAVTYAPPPGFPSDLTINGLDGGGAWGGMASSAKGEDVVAWKDDTSIPPGFIFLGDLVSIDDSTGAQLYPTSGGAQPQLNLSPLTLKDGTVPIGSCDQIAKETCTLNVTSLYEDARKPRTIPYEGGTTVLSFQRAIGASPGG